jgi:hypothetical protein
MQIMFVDIAVNKQDEIQEIGLAILGGLSVYPYGTVFEHGQSLEQFYNLMTGYFDSKLVARASWGHIKRETIEYYMPRFSKFDACSGFHINAKNYYSVLFDTEDCSLRSAMKRLLNEQQKQPMFKTVAAEGAYQAAQIFAAMIEHCQKKENKSNRERLFAEQYGK